jgi:anaerobic ribonucleoside-triphosphate reductase activating protein
MTDKIFLLDIVEDTTVDGPGFRTSLYAAGCTHHCPGCHNPHSWKKENGFAWSLDTVMERICRAEFSNVTFSGGDPLMQPEAFTRLACRIRRETRKTIWCYTGYLYERIIRSGRLSAILPYIDVLVDGPFIACLRDESLCFAGSSNQRIIDVASSLRADRLIRWNPESSGFVPFETKVFQPGMTY